MRRPRRRPAGARARAGFTVPELLVALLLLGAVTAIGLPVYLGALQRARETAAVAYLRQWPTAQEAFFAVQARYAASIEELVEAGFLNRIRSGQIGYDFGIGVAVADAPGEGRERLVEAPAASSWGSRFSPIGIAWGKAPKEGKDGKDGKATDTTEADAPAAQLPPVEPDVPPSGGEIAPPPVAGEAPGWEGWAKPSNGRGRHFYVDRSKVVRYADDGPAGKTSPAVPER
jgi:prepilin-type N-terminal cleavage/methylation domain-containing protein